MNSVKKEEGTGDDNRKDTATTKTTLISHNITVMGRRTSVRLEPEMWSALREISKKEGCRISDVCSLVFLKKNKSTSLTGAIRVFIMLYYRAAVTDKGHEKAGHGDFKNMIKRAGVPPEFFSGYTRTRYGEKAGSGRRGTGRGTPERKIKPNMQPESDYAASAH